MARESFKKDGPGGLSLGICTARVLWLTTTMVRKGVENKGDKMNPRQMYDVLWEKYGLYSLPSEHSIRLVISSMLDKIKREAIPMTKESTRAKPTKLTKKQQSAEVAMKDALKAKVRQRGWEQTKPMAAFDRLVGKGIGGRLTKKDLAVLTKPARSYWTALKSQKKSKRDRRVKKAMI